MCYLYDVLPTLGKLCGVTNKEPNDGREITTTLHDPKRAARSELVFAYREVQRGIRDDRWKLIRYPQVNKTQLFDLQDDPYERNDLADKTKSVGKVQELMARLEQALKQYGDTRALTIPNPKSPVWSPSDIKPREKKKN